MHRQSDVPDTSVVHNGRAKPYISRRVVSLLSNTHQRDGGSIDHYVPSADELRSASTDVKPLDVYALPSDALQPRTAPTLAKLFVVPPQSSLSLEDLTVEAFYERVCLANPDQRRNPDWDIVLDLYENYVVKNYGRDRLENILAAYRRVGHPFSLKLPNLC